MATKDAVRRFSEINATKEDMKRVSRTKKFKGGFSREVGESHAFQKYIMNDDPLGQPFVFGWIGSSARSKRRDKILETALRCVRLGPEAIGFWLTSPKARHLGDDPGRTTAEFIRRVAQATVDAFVDVTVWAHPDFCGTLESRDTLTLRIFGFGLEKHGADRVWAWQAVERMIQVALTKGGKS